MWILYVTNYMLIRMLLELNPHDMDQSHKAIWAVNLVIGTKGQPKWGFGPSLFECLTTRVLVTFAHFGKIILTQETLDLSLSLSLSLSLVA